MVFGNTWKIARTVLVFRMPRCALSGVVKALRANSLGWLYGNPHMPLRYIKMDVQPTLHAVDLPVFCVLPLSKRVSHSLLLFSLLADLGCAESSFPPQTPPGIL
jgi:hypothetical protein